ncbi:MAG: proton-conducting transporter membrane subunit [Collinsella sp.]
MVTMLFGFLMYLPKGHEAPAAFSTIAQLSYVFLVWAFGLWQPARLRWCRVPHLNHAFAKTLFFLIAGSFSLHARNAYAAQARGIMKKYPISGVGFSRSLAALPACRP